MVEKFINYIERGSWEEDLEQADDLLERFCWVVIIVASIYFGPAFLQVLAQAVLR